MSIMGVGFDLSKSAIKVADSALETVEKFATKQIKSTPDSSHKLMSALEQKAQYWQTKLTPGKFVGEARELANLEKKLNGEIKQFVEKKGLTPIDYKPCFSGPDRYDDIVSIAGEWYDAQPFLDELRKSGDEGLEIIEKFTKVRDINQKINSRWFFANNPFNAHRIVDPNSVDAVDQMLLKFQAR